MNRPHSRRRRLTIAPERSIRAGVGLAAFLGLFLTTFAAGDAVIPLTLKRREIAEHELCLVCAQELTADNGLGFYYRGRRIALDSEHLETFLQAPGRYFNQLQPRGALFQEGSARQIGSVWLLLGVWVLLGLVGAAICTGVALRKGLPPLPWFAAGLAANIAAVVLVLTRRSAQHVALPPRLAKIPTTAAPNDCSKCGGRNHPTARQCNECGAAMAPITESEVARVGLRAGQ